MHCIIIHLHLAWFCSANCIHSIFIVHMLCSLIHDPCIFLCKKKHKTKRKDKKKVTMKNEVYTTSLVTWVGYHDDSYKQTILGLYTDDTTLTWHVLIMGEFRSIPLSIVWLWNIRCKVWLMQAGWDSRRRIAREFWCRQAILFMMLGAIWRLLLDVSNDSLGFSGLCHYCKQQSEC